MAGKSLREHSDLVDFSDDLPLSSRALRSERGKGRGGGGGGGGGGGRGDQGRDVIISKALSKILRHDAEKEGLVLDSEGFARADELLKWKRLQSLKVTFSDLQTAVTDNAKQRFSLKLNPSITPIPDATSTDPSHWLIRANQGHSIAIESASLLKPITLEAGNVPDTAVHGTYYAFYPTIVESGGLKKMGRNHVHFSSGLPEDKQGVISGMRGDAEILIYIDIQKSLEEGSMTWWLSDNGVVLTEGDERGLVGTKYWKKVVGRRQDVGVLWEDGMEVGELPQSVRGRKAPSGKGPRGKTAGENSKGKDGGRYGGKGGRKGVKELDALGAEEGLGTEQAS